MLPPFYLARRQAKYNIQDLQNEDRAGLGAFFGDIFFRWPTIPVHTTQLLYYFIINRNVQ